MADHILEEDVTTAEDFIRYCQENTRYGPDSSRVQAIAWKLVLDGVKLPPQVMDMICGGMMGGKSRQR